MVTPVPAHSAGSVANDPISDNGIRTQHLMTVICAVGGLWQAADLMTEGIGF